jgi:hypothetical protein
MIYRIENTALRRAVTVVAVLPLFAVVLPLMGLAAAFADVPDLWRDVKRCWAVR